MPERIPTIYPVPFDGGGGPTQSCRHIATAMAGLGVKTPLFVLRNRLDLGGIETISALPAWSRHLPQDRTRAFGRRRLERLYFARTQPDEICVLWPGVSRDLIIALKDRGNAVVLEAINTPMAHARPILDRAYARLGAKPEHKITEARIAEENALFALADAIFCPSPLVEDALAETAFAGRVLSTSRGAAVTDTPPPDRRDRPAGGPVICLFVGLGTIRKGLDRLLELWPGMPPHMHLRVVGKIDPFVRETYAKALALPNVEAAGFVRNVAPHYAAADLFVLPSREEGDPKVTYEAAHAALPLVVSPAGGGRILKDDDVGWQIDPEDPETLKTALLELSLDAQMRHTLGQAAFDAVRKYDWTSIARRRLEALDATFPGRVPPDNRSLT